MPQKKIHRYIHTTHTTVMQENCWTILLDKSKWNMVRSTVEREAARTKIAYLRKRTEKFCLFKNSNHFCERTPHMNSRKLNHSILMEHFVCFIFSSTLPVTVLFLTLGRRSSLTISAAHHRQPKKFTQNSIEQS